MNKFKGERLESKSALSRNNLVEHLARYNLVPKGEVVLDVGCGTGHGSYELSCKFKEVLAVDISREALDYAETHWFRPNIKYIQSDGVKLPMTDHSIDTITAFEVFEHICDWPAFLKELKRVLKPGGRLYISTPNKTLYSGKRKINPHHCFEMTTKEFIKALRQFFTIEILYGQRTPIYNDHPIWKVVNPLIRYLPYQWNNTIKLWVINRIKPNLEKKDVIFKDDRDWLKQSRFVLAVCKS